MNRIAFVNGKGGVGKTTLSVLIATVIQLTNQSVSIDDRDPQLSATTAAGIFGIPLGEGGEFVIIDTAPSLYSPATIDAIETAELVVLVTSPSPLDLSTTASTAQLIQQHRPHGLTRLLFSLVQTNNRLFETMPQIAKSIPFPMLTNHLVRRTSYQIAQMNGWMSIPRAEREQVILLARELIDVFYSRRAEDMKIRT